MDTSTDTIIGDDSTLQTRVVTLLSNQLRVKTEECTMDSTLQNDLGADSLDIVEVAMAIEDEFKLAIPDEVVPTLKTVGDIVTYISESATATRNAV